MEFIDSLWLLISAIIAMVLLGVIAGFSPALYITQIGIATNTKRARSLMVALMIGVLLGIILLSVFFQFFQLDTLHTFIDSTIDVLLVSVIFNVIIGTLFIVGGLWYINKKPNRISEDKKVAKKSGYIALISFGFFRTFASISGATATFFASGIISNAKGDIVSRLFLTALFLAATIAPFFLILITMKRYPQKVEGVLEWLKAQLHRYNYKLVIGAGAVLVGSGIIIFNALRVILGF